ncbi:MAG: hypothetical protein KAR06_03850 [Deltaproteobacteria bacterium]|nr:hypothetical protein [Deltaproteobacteria bacterium]
MRGDNKIDDMISDCIDELSDDRVDAGVETLYELAIMWKTAGLTREDFAEICGYIEKQAAKKSEETFVQIKIRNALVKIREQKHGKILLRPLQ